MGHFGSTILKSVDDMTKKNVLLKQFSLESLKSQFLEIIDLLNARGVNYYLVGGALLGIVRNGDLLPWDRDTDIFVKYEDFNEFLNIVDELKQEGDWSILQKYSGFEFDDNSPKQSARLDYENILYLERPGCNLCMGNQEKAAKGDTVLATSTRLFQGRVVEDSSEKKGESLLASTPVVVLSAILGRTPTIDEYKIAVEGIDLTKFAPPIEKAQNTSSAHF